MARETTDVLSTALALPVRERARIAHELLLSLEDEGLIDLSAGRPVHWLEGTGWVKDSA